MAKELAVSESARPDKLFGRSGGSLYIEKLHIGTTHSVSVHVFAWRITSERMGMQTLEHRHGVSVSGSPSTGGASRNVSFATCSAWKCCRHTWCESAEIKDRRQRDTRPRTFMYPQ